MLTLLEAAWRAVPAVEECRSMKSGSGTVPEAAMTLRPRTGRPAEGLDPRHRPSSQWHPAGAGDGGRDRPPRARRCRRARDQAIRARTFSAGAGGGVGDAAMAEPLIQVNGKSEPLAAALYARSVACGKGSRYRPPRHRRRAQRRRRAAGGLGGHAIAAGRQC